MKKDTVQYTSIGGQALIEGVMMRGKDKVAMAVRKPDGEIVLKVTPLAQKFGWITKIPFLRGIFVLLSAMIIGVQALSYSSQFFAEGVEEDAFDRWVRKRFGKHADSILIGVSIAMAAGFAFLLFGFLPTIVTSWLRAVIPSPIWLSAVEGCLKFVFFIVYILVISNMKEIRRVFQYHGAEHKVIHNHESGRPISVENARTFTTLHPRCGTSFVFFVLAISIIVFSMVSWGSVWQRVALKLVLFPLIAGVSYEMIKFSQLSFMTPFRWPGMMLQKLTTREPDDRQLEVAIAAFQAVLTAEDAPAPSGGETRVPSA